MQVAQYAAPYEGNFLLSLQNLENRLGETGVRLGYVFPKSAGRTAWFADFAKRHEVFCVNDDVRHSVMELFSIMQSTNPVVVHTHFDGFDRPVEKAVRMYEKASGRHVHQVWHLHDHLGYVPGIHKKVYQWFCFFRHYNLSAKGAAVIAVSEEVLRFVKSFRTMFGGDFVKAKVIPNGIDLNRIQFLGYWALNSVKRGGKITHFTFLCFGGRNVQKRADILLEAASLLKQRKQVNVRVVLTEGTDTRQTVKSVCGGIVPEWVEITPQNHDVNKIFEKADCFVSSSAAETFSYAICEASIYGLPVIQSDIEGTLWNSANPSTFMFRSLSPESLAEQMLNVMAMDKQELKERCLVTSENNQKKYSLDSWSRQILDFYYDL